VFGAACLFCLCVLVLERTRRDEVRERKEQGVRKRARPSRLSRFLFLFSLSLLFSSIHRFLRVPLFFLSFRLKKREKKTSTNKKQQEGKKRIPEVKLNPGT